VAHAQAQSDDTAVAVPRITPPGGGGVGLPQPLAPSDAARIRRIFTLQEDGHFREAATATLGLGDELLLGDILADRYLSPSYQASTAELTGWLDHYAALPDAPAIRALLLTRLPKGAAAPPPPPGLALIADAGGADAEDTGLDLPRKPALDRAVQDHLSRDDPDGALRLIDHTARLDTDYAAQLRAEVARAIFADGKTETAYRLAQLALLESDGKVALPGFVAGLAAWREDQPDSAAWLFGQAADAAVSSPSMRAAAAFWAARANLRAGNTGRYRPWLRRAANEPLTFYGLLARRMLGGDQPRSERQPHAELGEADVALLDATVEGHRAFALLQVGQTDRAAAELQQLWMGAGADPGLRRAILLVAKVAELNGLSAQLTALLQEAGVKPPDSLPKLRPRGGFLMNPAIVYGLARLESNFDPHAVSPAGARGLLQIMPIAAQAVSGSDRTGSLDRQLNDPAFNLQLGQRYVVFLAQSAQVNDNLIRLLASYNAGPTRAAKWMDAVSHDNDPLLFIESIPYDETRDYVRRALTYIWIYAARLHVPAHSLDELAAGDWPRFVAEHSGADLTPRTPQTQVEASLH
jgi:soluble lytic murein transglycosylase